jgi:hypothetical protein
MILTHHLAQETISAIPGGSHLIAADTDTLNTAIAAFRQDGRGGRHDEEWVRQATMATQARKDGNFNSYEDSMFETFWASTKRELSDDEDEKAETSGKRGKRSCNPENYKVAKRENDEEGDGKPIQGKILNSGSGSTYCSVSKIGKSNESKSTVAGKSDDFQDNFQASYSTKSCEIQSTRSRCVKISSGSSPFSDNLSPAKTDFTNAFAVPLDPPLDPLLFLSCPDSQTGHGGVSPEMTGRSVIAVKSSFSPSSQIFLGGYSGEFNRSVLDVISAEDMFKLGSQDWPGRGYVDNPYSVYLELIELPNGQTVVGPRRRWTRFIFHS